jgi:CHAD domain-containing protein
VAERELKLEASPQFHLPDLTGIEGAVATPPQTRQLHTTYWDTPDLRLARWGCSLRYRRDEGWTVKLAPAHEGQLMVREELNFPGSPGRPPGAALDLLRAYVRRSPLVPVATLRTKRVGMRLVNARGAQLAEVVDDEVSVLEGRRLALRFRQIEVELRNGTTDDVLHEIVDQLRAAGAGSPDPTPKHIRALGPRSVEPPEISPQQISEQSSAAEAIRSAIAASVVRLTRHDAGVRLGFDPEDVHQARVATRRLRSDLRTFQPLLDAEWSDALRDELRWLGALLGEVRDADVMLDKLQSPLRLDRVALRTARPILRRVRSRRVAARRKLLVAMRSDRYIDLLERLVEAAREPSLLVGAQEAGLAVLPPLAARPWVRLRTAVASLPSDPGDEQLHAIRIAAKRSRYAAEAAAPVAGRRAKDFAAAVAELQGVLGDLNDAVVLRAWLARTAEQLTPAAAFVAGGLAERERQAATKARAAWRDVWDRVARRRLHQWMATS